MRPSEIREQILAEHRRVLSLLDSTERCARLVAQGRGDAGELRRLAHVLEEIVGELLDEEGSLLDPELRQLDAFGDQRVGQLERSHRRQRALLANCREVAEAQGVEPRLLGERMLATVEGIRADLQKEQQRFLNAEVLRDDLVIVSQSDG